MSVSTVSLRVDKQGIAGGGSESAAPSAFSNAAAPDTITVQAFTANTYAAVTVPSGATGVLITPPAANTGAITIKGVTGDTGVSLHKTNPTFLSLDSGATFGLLCVSAISVTFVWS